MDTARALKAATLGALVVGVVALGARLVWELRARVNASAASPSAPVVAGAAASSAAAVLRVRVLFASTTGAARRYAARLARDAVAMSLGGSGFHMSVSVVDLASFNVEALEEEDDADATVILMPTWTCVWWGAAVRALAEEVRASLRC